MVSHNSKEEVYLFLVKECVQETYVKKIWKVLYLGAQNMKLGGILWRMWLTAISVGCKDCGLMKKKN